MKEPRKVKVRRRAKREIPLAGVKPPETGIVYRRETETAQEVRERPIGAEDLSLALERDARRYSGLWEVEL